MDELVGGGLVVAVFLGLWLLLFGTRKPWDKSEVRHGDGEGTR